MKGYGDHRRRKKTNIAPLFQNGKKGKLRNYSVTSVPGNTKEEILLEVILKDEKAVGNSWHEYKKGK